MSRVEPRGKRMVYRNLKVEEVKLIRMMPF